MEPHSWRVVFRNDKQGFVKTVRVLAVGFSQSVTFATDVLKRSGYDPAQFEVVEVIRKWQVSVDDLHRDRREIHT